MDLQTLSAGQVSTSVWSAAARTLTTLQPPLSITTAVQQSLAASTSASLKPAVSTLRLGTIVVVPSATGAAQVLLDDGTSVWNVASAAAGGVSYTSPLVITSRTLWLSVKNVSALDPCTYGYILGDIV